MRAAQFHAARDIRLTTSAPTPTSPSANRVTIDIEWCGICGSDLHEYLVGPIVIPTSERGAHSITGEVAPITLGHEFCGRVAQLPDGYKGDLKVGAPVMVDPRINCRSCTACLGSSSGTNAVKGCGGRTSHLCKKWGFIGLSGGGGGLSEQVSVWADMCYALPDTPDILKNAALIEPLAVARHGVQRTEISDFRDKNVLILGGGPIGVAVVMDLKVLGVKQVIVSEPTETRQKGVAKLVDVVLNPKTEDVPERCRELTEGRGVDVVFDCAGVGPAMMNGMAALKTQGMYMNVAGWETPFTVPFQYWMLKEIDLRASFGYDEDDFALTVKNFSEGKYQGLEDMVTARIGLEEVKERGFDELINNKDKHVKILVTPKAELLQAS